MIFDYKHLLQLNFTNLPSIGHNITLLIEAIIYVTILIFIGDEGKGDIIGKLWGCCRLFNTNISLPDNLLSTK